MSNQFNVSLWGDEGFSAILSMKSLPEIIRVIITDTSPPLWNIFEWIVFNTLGTDEIYIRLLAFTFFLGTVFFTYKIGEYLWGRRTGMLAASLTFLNPFFFIYAFEGRMYSILALGVTASMYFFLRIISEKKTKTVDKIGYVVAVLWAMYSHHFAIFAVFLQGMWFIYEFFKGNRKAAITIFKLFIAIGIGYLPWIIPLYNQTKMVGAGFWLGTPTATDLIGILGKYLGAGIPHSLQLIAPWPVVAIFVLRRWSKKFLKYDLFFVSWFLVPIALTWAVSQVFQSIFFDRYLLYTIPAAMLILASQRRKMLSTIALAIVLFLFVNIDFHYFTNPTKRPFRELAAYVKETRQEGDFLVNWNAGSHHLWETKYYGIPAPIYVPGGEELPFFVGTALMEEGDVIQKIPEDTPRVGVVTSGSVDDINLPGYTRKESITLSADSPGAGEIHFVWLQKEK